MSSELKEGMSVTASEDLIGVLTKEVRVPKGSPGIIKGVAPALDGEGIMLLITFFVDGKPVTETANPSQVKVT